ncbi:MAG: T9SS type A sorting domain-containing protein [Lentimicrobiaceae bacterium]|nr:T9SS type A sorting domain-containing protein [Lentimicrobiaceae bacterium]
MKIRFLLFTAAFILAVFSTKAQDKAIHPTLIGNGVFMGETLPLRDIPPATQEELEVMKEKALRKAANKKIEPRLYPYAETALPKGPDAAWQKKMGEKTGSKAPIVNFEGQSTSAFPPDCNGTAGPNHYMQTVNSTYAIYSKTGTLLAGPTNMNLLFGSVAGANCNDGDPLIQYDEQADRWIAVEFSLCGSNDLMLVAVSSTNDPTGTWFQYSFDVTDTPDYEKIGVWQDGYYMGTNTSSGNDIYVFERSKMLLGQPAQMVAFDNPWRPGSGFLCVPPLDNDGVAAPSGSPGMFIAFNDDAVAGGSDQLWLYELAVNWTTPSSSTFNRVQQLAVTPFDSQFNASWNDITQPNSQKLDGVPQVIMNAPQYRNFGTYQTIVCCHTVDVDATNHAGIRWYELRKTSPSTTWTIRQQGTFAPDAHSRWMGSIMLNGSGKIALGYSISSSTIYPGIRYCGQSASAYAAASGLLDIAEESIYNGTVAQISYNRWGDYALMSVDPTDDQTFWFSTEYVKTGGTSKGTRIASFKFGNDPAVVTLPATAITGNSATINGTVNPNGLATTYYFQWGTTSSYGNSTPVNSAGSGTAAVAVNASLSSLNAGTTYHFRLAATNSDGTAYGSDLTFTPGAASVTTTTASQVGTTTATAGGNVITDGGTPVTARGVCWATSANPEITDNHTTDGSGLGEFTSSITGLNSNTPYHYRAYATNSSGTYYGEDLTFTTACGIISTFPWNEGFENGGTIPGCWTQEQVNNSGIYWTFITGNGGSNPASAHSGTFNACLKDATASDNKTKLITPTLNLNSISSPVLKFWHTQQLWSPDQDQLTVFYKTSANGSWTQLASYTTSITSWTEETINLPNPGSEYYIAFEGNAKYGRGVCVDDVSITGSATGPTLSVTPANQDVAATAGNTSFAVTSNTAWTAASDQTWCTVTSSGNGNSTITATFTANPLLTQRVASITVTVAGLTPVVVTVTQAGTSPNLLVTPANQNVAATAGNTSFAVTSNTAWTAASDQTWCTVTSSGNGNGTITATFTANPLLTQRVASITVTAAGLTPVVVTVTQAGTSPTLLVTPANQNVNEFAGAVEYIVTSNSSWTASSDSAWCLVTAGGIGNGTIVANYSANPYYDSRVATISVTTSGLPVQRVTLTQAQTTVSVQEVEKNEIRLIPNPARGLFSIYADQSSFSRLEVSIVTLAGATLQNRVCQGDNIYKFDMSTAPQGCYFVKIKTPKEILIRKLVIIK